MKTRFRTNLFTVHFNTSHTLHLSMTTAPFRQLVGGADMLEHTLRKNIESSGNSVINIWNTIMSSIIWPPMAIESCSDIFSPILYLQIHILTDHFWLRKVATSTYWAPCSQDWPLMNREASSIMFYFKKCNGFWHVCYSNTWFSTAQTIDFSLNPKPLCVVASRYNSFITMKV